MKKKRSNFKFPENVINNKELDENARRGEDFSQIIRIYI